MSPETRAERFFNGLWDRDWPWWPVLFLRPPRAREASIGLLLVLAAYSTVVALTLVVATRVALGAAVEPRGLLVIGAAALGFALLLLWTTFAIWWNRRARRLRG